MTGKEKCKMLKELRAKIAEDNGIAGFEYKDCPYQGPCDGTCPACDAEAEKLYNELKKLGKEPPLCGISPNAAEELLDTPMSIVEPPDLMGEFTADYFDYKPENDIFEGKIVDSTPSKDRESPHLVLGQMECTPPQEPEKPTAPPRDRLPGKVIDRRHVKRGKLSQKTFEKEQMRIDNDSKKPRGLLGIFKKKDE